MTRGAPQGLVLGPAVLNICVGNMDSGTEFSLSKFTGDTKLSGAIGTLEGKDYWKSKRPCGWEK